MSSESDFEKQTSNSIKSKNANNLVEINNLFNSSNNQSNSNQSNNNQNNNQSTNSNPNSNPNSNSNSNNQTNSPNVNIQNSLNNQPGNLLATSSYKQLNSTGNSSSNSILPINSNTTVLDDELSILVDHISTNQPKITDQINQNESTTSNLTKTHFLNSNLSNKMTTIMKKPNDLLDVACQLAIHSDFEDNSFNDELCFEIAPHSESNCDLSEIVNNSILESDLILDEETDEGQTKLNDWDSFSDLLNENENQSKYLTDRTKFNLTSQACNLNTLNNSLNSVSNNVPNSTLSNILNSTVTNEENNNLSSNSLKKSRTSNVHLSYLLQSKPQDLPPSNHQLINLQKHQHARKLTTDDNLCG